MEKPMAPDERDRSFDKALARHLHSAAPAGQAAGMSGELASQGACPDPETLAAYHERSLLPEQLNSLKEHLVGCGNCQAVLAHLETTDQIALPAFTEKEQLGKESDVLTAAISQPTPGASSPRKSRRVLLLRGARWQWLAPAGAVAAGLLVWIALHENQPLPLPSPKQDQVALHQAPPPPSPSVSGTMQEVSPAPKALPTKPQPAADEFASAKIRSASGAEKMDSKQEYLTQASPSRGLAGKESRLRKDAGRSASTDQLRAEVQLDRDAKTAANATQENAEVQLQAQASNTQLQNQSNAPKVPGPAPLGQMEAKKMKAAAGAPAPQPGVAGGIVSSYNDSASLEVARAITNPRLISPPGLRVIWRVGRSGLIELSKDSGSSWSRQTSGVLADLLTGSAPSDQVCWIVGQVGAVVLTTDGGAHWKIVRSPLAEDLGGVRAFDAHHATIWNARGTKSFETTDGGLTWKPVPNP
jgi:hypothetical protein